MYVITGTYRAAISRQHARQIIWGMESGQMLLEVVKVYTLMWAYDHDPHKNVDICIEILIIKNITMKSIERSFSSLFIWIDMTPETFD